MGQRPTGKKKPFWRKPKTPKQRAKDAKMFACGRKVMYMSEGEAKAVAERLQHRAYLCAYSSGLTHWHTAHLPGAIRLVRTAQ